MIVTVLYSRPGLNLNVYQNVNRAELTQTRSSLPPEYLGKPQAAGGDGWPAWTPTAAAAQQARARRLL